MAGNRRKATGDAMGYADPQKQREYQREYKRGRRAGDCQTPGQTLLPSSFRLKTAQDILALLSEQFDAVRADSEASTLEKARTIGFLAGVALRAVEAADTSARLEALERVFKLRKEDESWKSLETTTN